MNYTEIKIPVKDTATIEMAIALLADSGFESFEETVDSLLAFIPEHLFNEKQTQEILNSLQITYSFRTIAQQNWNADWEKNFEPVRVGKFAGVRAGFHKPFVDVKHEIIITPKMSFGTGHHATTWLMMQAMEPINFKGANVFDFGTGTGILAILAEKLGADSVLATDIDDWCIENALENIAINHCNKIRVEKSDTVPQGKFQHILANINYTILVATLQNLAGICEPGGIILLSGLLTADLEPMRGHIHKAGLNWIEHTSKNGWICIRSEKPLNSI